MCLNLLSFHNHPKYNFILVANRDEFYSRPTARAHFWEEHKNLLAGKDLSHGGTWLGVTTNGKIGSITNYRDLKNLKKDPPSRGQLLTDFLTGNERADAFIQNIRNPEKYNGFNLLIGDTSQLLYFSNYLKDYKILEPGNYSLGNAALNEKWPKEQKGMKLFEAIINNNFRMDDLFNMMLDEEKFPVNLLPNTGLGIEKEQDLSSIYIRTPEYGTVSTTVLLIDKENNVSFSEKNYLPLNIEAQTKTFNFKIQTTEKV